MSSEEPSQVGVIPYLLSPDCQKHLQWMENALGAKTHQVVFKDDSKKKVMHSSAVVNGGLVYLADGEKEDVTDVDDLFLHMAVNDPDGVWKSAHAHGVTTQMDLKEQFWGSKYGQFRDPFGYVWSVSESSAVANGVTPYLLAPGGVSCENMIKWVSDVHKGQEKDIRHWPDGKIMHCEIAINGGTLFMSDGPPDRVVADSPPNHSFILHMDVGLPKVLWKTALEKGATSVVDMKVQQWGELYGMFRDEFGFQWGIKEPKDVTPLSGLFPSFITPDCSKHIDWIKTVFSGKVRQIYHSPDKKVAHCMMEVNNGHLYLCDSSCVLEGGKSSIGEPRGVTFQLECSDPNGIWEKAMANNATAVIPLKMQFWGELYGTFKDPLGYEWALRQPALLAKKTNAENGQQDQE